MKPLNNYANIQEYTEIAKLPAGAYKVKITRAEEQNGALCVLFDIAEGDYKDYFMSRFRADKKQYPDTAKYKGVYRLWYPSGNEYDTSNERRMKTALEKIKSSNNLKTDFSKEWDGNDLKGCLVGMIFRDEEYDYNGYQGFSAKPYGLVTLEDFESGKFRIPEKKCLSGSSAASTQQSDSFVELADDDDLPF